jgi:rhamnogalacturonan endolyase
VPGIVSVKMVRLTQLASLWALATTPALAAFGLTQSGNNYVLDAGSSNPLIISVSRSSCDINSIRYRGVELQDPQGTHIGSGLGSASVSAQQLSGSGGNYIKVTCNAGTLTQYIVIRQGDSTVFMATYITQEPSIGEMRFIARLKSSVLPQEQPFGSVSTTSGSSSAIEGSDVFLVNGQTRSKFYSSERFIDRDAQCVWGDNNGDVLRVCTLAPQMESSSGGPFFRDIESNNAGTATNLYFYMNSGHVQTEAFRTGLHGPYMMTFSRSGTPTVKGADLSWFQDLGIQGYVPNSQRGSVAGRVSGINTSQFKPVVHWFNSAAQYWTYANSDGSFTSPLMKPGTYTMVLYQTEFKVAQSSVTVSAGGRVSKDIASGLTSHNTLWQIGAYDGQPFEFLNGDKFLRMHPSDSRMSSWSPRTFTVGSSQTRDMPMAIFQAVNNPQTINFNLDSAPSGGATLRIATTLSFAGARPSVNVNGWAGPTPAAPTKIDSRGVTRGAYRGFGEVYDVSIPAGTLRSGSNTITISAASGSSGTTFLSPNFILDAIELFT